MKLKQLLIALMVFVGVGAQAQQIVFTPQWTAQSQFAGYYVAQEMGFYEEAGVDVVIEHTSTSDFALNRLLRGQSNAITMLLFDAISHISQGVEIVNVLQTSQRSGHVIVVRDDNIKKIEDLQGLRVGIWRSNFNQLADLINLDYGLNIEWITFIQSINLYISGAIDATLAMTYNELYWIRSSGFENKRVISMDEIGHDYPDEGLYVSREYCEKYPDKARAFAEASRRGWEWARQNPEKTLEIVLKVMEREHVPASRRHQEWMLNEVLKLQCPQGASEPSFALDPEKVDALNRLLVRYGRINKGLSVEQLQGR
ncbi:MAG: ABC transporter substrate-binding protein [Alistipes sp.]|nr:ABC transporter substrate-binding protein [Alistipes sp.]